MLEKEEKVEWLWSGIRQAVIVAFAGVATLVAFKEDLAAMLEWFSGGDK